MAAEADGARRVYSDLLEPTEHPDYDRRVVKPPTWATFKNRTQFTCLRGFGAKDGQSVGFAEELEKFTRTHELGDVIWPSYDVLFAKNLGDLADEIKRRDLYLFDIWGYVPGSGPGGYWQQFTPPTGALATLESKLGERWLGTDIGEQDGRYIWGNLPYEPGDYLTDAVLDLLYPGYQNSSYFHDESGFITPTPFGDLADCLLSDAPLWVLERYPVVIVAGELSGGNPRPPLPCTRMALRSL